MAEIKETLEEEYGVAVKKMSLTYISTESSVGG
jgi:hypothetical protein